MHILLGLILVVAALMFAPWLVAIAVGLMASYWAFGIVIAVVVIAFLLIKPLSRAIRGLVPDGYSIEPPPAVVGAANSAFPEPTKKPVEKPAPVIRLSLCGSCGESIKRHSMFCPSCGRDPRTKH